MRPSCVLLPCIFLVLLALTACGDGRGASLFAGSCEALLACCAELSPDAKSQCEDAYHHYRDADGAERQCQAALESTRATGFCADTPGSLDVSVNTDDGGVPSGSDQEVLIRVASQQSELGCRSNSNVLCTSIVFSPTISLRCCAIQAHNLPVRALVALR